MNLRGSPGIFLFIVSFGLYLHGAYPTVSVGDSGEFITAGNTLGIPHAPGYPTYVLLAKTIQKALPWANNGYRNNLFSAVCAALAILLFFLTACRIGISPELALCASLVFMLSPALRANAQASEVFALHALFCSAVLCAAFWGRWRLTAFLLGLGMGNHQTLLFLVPAIGLAYFARPADERGSLMTLMLSFAAGLSVYGVLYFRADQSPVLNAGNPNTLERLWRVFTRADYGSLTLALGETPHRDMYSTGSQLARFARGLGSQVTWAGLLIGILGIGLGLRKNVPVTLTLLVGFLMIGPFFFLLGNLPFDAQSTGLLERFYIAPALCWMLLASMGLHYLVGTRLWLSRAALILPVCLMATTVHAFPFRADFRAYAYGRNNLRTLPPHALFLMDGGDDTFYTLAYLTHVEGRRTDVELRDRGSVVFPGFYGDDFRLLTRDEKVPRREQVEMAALAAGRPLYYSTMNENILPGKPLEPQGLLYGSRSVPTALWTFYDLRGVQPWQRPENAFTDYRTRALLPFYAYQRSVQLARSGDIDAALHWASAAQKIGPDVVWLLPNLMHNAYFWADADFKAGRLARAEAIYHQMLAWNPQEAAVWANLGAVEEKSGHVDDAVAAYQKAIQIDPGSEAAHYNLAVAYWKLNQWSNVVEELNRVLSLNPSNTAARNYLIAAKARLP